MASLNEHDIELIEKSGGIFIDDEGETIRFGKTCKPDRTIKKLLKSYGYKITNASGASFSMYMEYVKEKSEA